jgi:DNA invertase Pin-like site-specific DNA recombinase
MTMAYSYQRFSTSQQAEGDSIRRQVEKTRQWCERNCVALDDTLRDEGVSGYKGRHRENPDTHALAAFLERVKKGDVPRGSFLIVESLDRLSREDVDEALELLLSLTRAGVKVVQLIPVETVYAKPVEPMKLMMAIMELNRGNSESKVKSERVGAAWRQKKANAAKDRKPITGMTPGWIVRDGDRFTLDRKKAETVRRIFALAREGLGVGRIAKALNAEKVPLLGRTEFRGTPLVWSVNVIYKVLTNRAVYGEYQPHVGSRGPERKPAGEPIADYYPAVIDRETFDAVRGLMRDRAKNGRGWRGTHVNLFAGLLKDARTGGSLTTRHGSTHSPVLLPVQSRTTTGKPWVSFMLEPFEQMLVKELAEVKAEDLGPATGAAAQVEAMEGRLAEVETLRAKWRAKMDNPDLVDAVAAKLAELGAEARELSAKLDEARREAATPAGEALAQAKAAAPDLSDDGARVRYRAAIRRVVAEVRVLVVPGNGLKEDRLAAAQVWFKGGACRSYVLAYRVRKDGTGHTRVETEPRSFAVAGVPEGSDLRTAAGVATVEKLLRQLREKLRGDGLKATA